MNAGWFILRAMRQILVALLLAAGLLSGPLHAQDAADELPEGIEAGASKIAACFLPGELDELDARIDAARLPLPGCATGLIAPERAIGATRSYLPGNGSVVDCASMRRRQENSRQLYAFLGDVVAAAEGSAPACAAAMIRAWAEADAMAEVAPGAAAGPSETLGMFVLGGLASTYLIHPKVRAAAGDDGDKVILGWFGRRSAQVAQNIDQRVKAGRHSNILYWEGFSILPTALMTADPDLLQRSRATFRIALKEVTADQPAAQDDGFLPAELGRGDKALTYQVFATQAIVGSATLSQAYGCDFLDGAGRRNQFVSLLARSIEGSFDPGVFTSAAVRLGASPKPIDQQQPGTVRRAPQLLYLVNRIDPRLADRVDAELAKALGKPQPVVAPSAGARAVNDRLGGGYARLADQAVAMAAKPAPAPLRKLCGG